MNVSVFSADLLDQSKIRKSLGSSDVHFSTSLDSLLASPSDVFLIDLKNPEAVNVIAGLSGKLTIGFGSHVDIDRMNAASAAGCTLTVPRSRFFARMNDVIEEAKSNE